jgi:hypothetical protein
MKYFLLTLLTTITAFSPSFYTKLPTTYKCNSFLEEIPEDPKIVYRYRGIPPKLCATLAEEQMLERMARNYSEHWVTTSGIDWENYPDENLDNKIDNQIDYFITNFTSGDK